MGYKSLNLDEFLELMEAIRYVLTDYSNFIAEEEPLATRTIQKVSETAMSLPDEEEDIKRFIDWLNKQ